jgi:hypothetical protein
VEDVVSDMHDKADKDDSSGNNNRDGDETSSDAWEDKPKYHPAVFVVVMLLGMYLPA